MNRLSTPRAARLFACLLFGLLCLAASRPMQAATINIDNFYAIYNVYNGGVYGMEYVDKLDTSFHADWVTQGTYCTYTITMYVSWYDSAGLLIAGARQDVLQQTSHSSPTNIGDTFPFGYSKYTAETLKPARATSAMCKYVLTVVVADGINIYASRTRTSNLQTVNF